MSSSGQVLGRVAMVGVAEFMKVALARSKTIVGPPPPIVPFAEWDYYYLSAPLSWVPNPGCHITMSVRVPKGFVTDLASVPRMFWSALPPNASYSYPAIIHDYLYWMQPCERHVADDILKLAMGDMKVSAIQAIPMYEAVRLAGSGAWAANAAARRAGESRLLKTFPDDVNTTWGEWKKNPDVFDKEEEK